MRFQTVARQGDKLGLCDIDVPLLPLADSPEPLTAARWKKVLDLIRHLRSGGPDAEVWAHVFGNTLYLHPAHARERGVSIKLWIDWRDHGPMRDGLPVLHYRLQIQRPGSRLSEDARTEDPEEVRQILCRAFGWAP